MTDSQPTTTRPPLQRLVLSNFRSIAGEVDIPLDAPVVLIHGPNGSGKTSLLSGLELALTGEIQALERQDDAYWAHLAHIGERFAAVQVELATSDGQVASLPMTVGARGLQGAAALDAQTRRFFAERCYLDQVTLGRLLDVYQATEPNRESSLARFVNELLGLDDLDSLIDGLQPSTHKATLRNLVPEFDGALRDETELSDHLASLVEQRENIEGRREEARANLLTALNAAGLPEPPESEGTAGYLLNLRSEPAGELDPRTLGRLSTVLSEVRGLLEATATRPSSAQIRLGEDSLQKANAALEEWGTEIQEAIRRSATLSGALSHLLPEQDPSTIIQGLVSAEEVASERRRFMETQLSTSDAFVARLETVDTTRAALIAATRELEDLVVESSDRSTHLAEALAGIAQHIQGGRCPVCDRDFNEVNDAPLAEHVSQKIASLTDEGLRLQDLITRRDTSLAELASLERDRDALEARVLSADSRSALEENLRELVELEQALTELSDTVSVGRRLLRAASAASDEVAQLRTSSTGTQAAMTRLGEVAKVLRVQFEKAADPRSALEYLSTEVERQRDTAELRATHLSEASAAATELDALSLRIAALDATVAAELQRQATIKRRLAALAQKREEAKRLRASAIRSRESIVSRIFNDSLNRVWRDVFVRLAPQEPFVPAFGLPEPSRRFLKLNLETIHRDGSRAGAPGTMLSAGNLNTAALSLFIALHLVVRPELSCLVFDDPIQSMDEVHVAQFAGLLRLLSKQHGRQLVLAIHERELFEYLTLELSPAFSGDSLITVELSPDPNGPTVAKSVRHTWRSDEAIAV